jgi:hypothetical protein
MSLNIDGFDLLLLSGLILTYLICACLSIGIAARRRSGQAQTSEQRPQMPDRRS